MSHHHRHHHHSFGDFFWYAIGFWALLHLLGCGGEGSPAVPTATSTSSTDAELYLNNQLSSYEKTCIDDNEALFPSQYETCLPVFGKVQCDLDQETNTLKLNAEWESIKSWVKAIYDQCISLGNSEAYCFSTGEMELSRRSEYDCRSQVMWL